MRVAFFATLALATALLGAASPPDDPQALLAKHRAFVGWSTSDGSIRSLHLLYRATSTSSGRVPSPAPSGAIASAERDEYWMTDGRYRDVITGGADASAATESGFDGRTFWRTNMNGNVVPLDRRNSKIERAWSAMCLEETPSFPGTARGHATVDGVDTAIVRVEPPGATSIDLYVDPQSGAYRRVVVDPSGRYPRSTDIVRYDEVLPGKRLIGMYRASNGGTAYELTHAEVDRPVAPADLRPSGPRSSWTFGTADPLPIDVREHTQQIGPGGSAVLVTAVVEGHRGVFLLDSGASSILLSKTFGAFARSPAMGKRRIGGVNGGTIEADIAQIDTLAVGPHVLHDVMVDVASTDALPGRVDGILGYDFFAQAIVDVDLDAKQMRILDPARFAASTTGGAHPFDVDLSDLTPRADVTIDGKLTAHVTFDTGDDMFVVFADAFRRASAAQIWAQQFYMGGIDGTSQVPASCGTVQELRLGSVRYLKAPTCFASTAAFGDDGGAIGFDFLRHFNWTFDYPDGKLVLTPNASR